MSRRKLSIPQNQIPFKISTYIESNSNRSNHYKKGHTSTQNEIIEEKTHYYNLDTKELNSSMLVKLIGDSLYILTIRLYTRLLVYFKSVLKFKHINRPIKWLVEYEIIIIGLYFLDKVNSLLSITPTFNVKEILMLLSKLSGS